MLQPPRLAILLLRWFCHAEIVEETEGDLFEIFQQRVQQKGLWHARIHYWTDVFYSLNPWRTVSPRHAAFTRKPGYADNLRHFLKIAFRNMIRSKTSSIINVAGLAVSLACFLLITFYLNDELTFESMHADPDNTYRISYSFRGYDNQENQDARAAGLWSLKLKEAMPEVQEVVRFSRFGYPGNVWAGTPDHVFIEQQFYWADSTFANLFHIDLLTPGDVRKILASPQLVIMNESSAKKYFGQADAVGQTVNYTRDGIEFKFIVAAVMKDFPSNTHLKPDFIANAIALDPLWRRNSEDRINSWGDSFSYSFIQLAPGTSLEEVENNLQRLFNENLGEFAKTTHPVLVPLRDIHFAKGFMFELDAPGDRAHLYIFASIAILIIVMACINYMNLATARSMRRSKEVGLRKTLGVSRISLIAQFIGESLVVTTVSLIIAFVLVILLLPSFNALTAKQFDWHSLAQAQLLRTIAASTLVIGILSGSYPALYLSGFRPVEVLKGLSMHGAGPERFRKVLVVVQVSITIIFLTSAYVVREQLSFIDHSRISAFKDQILTVRLGGDVSRDKIPAYKQLLEQTPQVSGITVGPHLPRRENFGFIGKSFSAPSVSGMSYDWDFFNVDADFATMFNLELISGRNFSASNPQDSAAIILNEEAVRQLGITPEQAVGIESEDISYYHVKGEPVAVTNKRSVIGVVKDFNYESLKNKIRGVVLSGETSESEMMYVRMNGDNFPEVIEQMQKAWKQVYPATPFQHWFLDEEFGRLYQTEREMSRIFTALAAMAVFISRLGLFGLASFTAEQKTREIGIRKVLGATSTQIMIKLTSGFTKLVVVAFIIGIPVAAFVAHAWMETFAYKVEIGSWIYVASAAFVLFITIMAVAMESIRAATANPSSSIRHE